MALKAGEKYGKELESGVWVFKKDQMGNEYMEKTTRIYINKKKAPQDLQRPIPRQEVQNEVQVVQ